MCYEHASQEIHYDGSISRSGSGPKARVVDADIFLERAVVASALGIGVGGLGQLRGLLPVRPKQAGNIGHDRLEQGAKAAVRDVDGAGLASLTPEVGECAANFPIFDPRLHFY